MLCLITCVPFLVIQTLMSDIKCLKCTVCQCCIIGTG